MAGGQFRRRNLLTAPMPVMPPAEAQIVSLWRLPMAQRKLHANHSASSRSRPAVQARLAMSGATFGGAAVSRLCNGRQWWAKPMNAPAMRLRSMIYSGPVEQTSWEE